MLKNILIFVVWWALLAIGSEAQCQHIEEDSLSGPDALEHAVATRHHLFGEWNGYRQRLLQRGVSFDVQYLSDSLWNIRSDKSTRLANWSRVRGTADIDFSRMTGASGLFLHVTALWQGGGNMGAYLGTITGPSGMSSANTFRLDSWWLEKRFLQERVAIRAGQFAGQDFYGAQHYAASFVFEPMGYALSNLSNTYEVYDPPSTPAAEARVAPFKHAYVKAMVMAGDRDPYSHNPTGLVPQFRGRPVTVNEIGFTPGKKATGVRAFDNVEERRGYSGLYQLGSAYNPGKFTESGSPQLHSSNYLVYLMASQAVYRVDRASDRGLDVTAAYDWSPSRLNSHDKLFTAGLRVNEPLRIRQHNTFSLGYVRTGISPYVLTTSVQGDRNAEHAAECNLLVDLTPMIVLQPVLQYYAHVGGSNASAAVFGFRTKIDF